MANSIHQPHIVTRFNMIEMAKADKYKDNPGVRCLLQSIEEISAQQKANHSIMIARLEFDSKRAGNIDDRGYDPINQMQIVSNTVAQLNILKMTLACLLEVLGEKVEY